jgi:hypothetical protein
MSCHKYLLSIFTDNLFAVHTGCYGSPRNKQPPTGLVKINIFSIYHFFRKFFKTELTLNPKMHTRSCVYTSIDNKARKKITRLKFEC